MKSISTHQFFLEDIFAEGWRAFTAIFAKCAPVVLVFGFIVNLLVETAESRLGLDALVEAGRLTAIQRLWISSHIEKAFSFLIFSVAVVAVVKCAERAVTRREISAAEAVAEGLRRWPRYLWTGFLGGLIVAGLSCLLLIPGLIWAVYYMFVPYAVSVTSLTGKKALDYSKSLVRDSFLRTIGYFFVVGFATGVQIYVIGLLGQAAANLLAPHLPRAALPAVFAAVRAVAQLPVVFQLSLGTVFFLNTAYLRRKAPGC